MSYRRLQPSAPVLGATFSALPAVRVGVKRRKRRKASVPTYTLPTNVKWLSIPQTVVNTLKTCCDVGTALHSGIGTGDEFGGHLKIHIEGDTVHVDGISSHELSVGHTSVGDDTTGVNSGDHPFTFHTHPSMRDTGGAIVNYPDQISIEDLKGIFEDHFTRGAGHLNVCDVLATPSGIQVYYPINPVSTLSQSLDELFSCLDSANESLQHMSGTEYDTGKSDYFELLHSCGVHVEHHKWGEIPYGVNIKIGHSFPTV